MSHGRKKRKVFFPLHIKKQLLNQQQLCFLFAMVILAMGKALNLDFTTSELTLCHSDAIIAIGGFTDILSEVIVTNSTNIPRDLELNLGEELWEGKL
jgi:hypothetical protein